MALENFPDVLAGGGLGAILTGLYNKFMVERKIESAQKTVDELALFSARTYITNEDLKNFVAPINDQLKMINLKLDHLSEKKLDK